MGQKLLLKKRRAKTENSVNQYLTGSLVHGTIKNEFCDVQVLSIFL